jgi:predicted site-specific integrase-resolvase
MVVYSSIVCGVKLSEYARRNGIKYRAAWNRYKAGKIPGAYMDDSGHVVVPEPQVAKVGLAAVYARVSSAKHKDDLVRQRDRMVGFANAAGLSVVQVVAEVASGVNDSRPKLTALLEDDSWGTLVVEHRDRLTRVGFKWFEVLLARCGKRIVVANAAQEETSDLVNDFVSITYSFATRMYGPRSARSRTDAAVEALEAID